MWFPRTAGSSRAIGFVSIMAATGTAAMGYERPADLDRGASSFSPPRATLSAAPAKSDFDRCSLNAGMQAKIRDDDLLLLSVDLENLAITDAFYAYGAPDDPLVPLGELARLLDLDISISFGERTVTGRLGQSGRRLTIDLASGVANVDRSRLILCGSDYVETPSDIFFRTSVLERLLSLTMRVDAAELQLKLQSQEKLPIQARLERAAQIKALRGETIIEALQIDSPYSAWSPPAFDISLQLGLNSARPRFLGGYEFRVGGDLLYTGYQAYLAADRNGKPVSARVEFERHEINGGLLGPLDATRIGAGDVFTPAMSLGARASNGRGIFISNAPLQEASVFNKIDLRGAMPAESDAQLFVNGALQAGQLAPVQGQYEFLDVPLQRGLNDIQIIISGPRGERQIVRRAFYVGGGQVKKGQFNYSASIVQQDTPLIDLRPQDRDLRFGLGQGNALAILNAAYGVSDEITVAGSIGHYTPAFESARTVVSAGTRSAIFGAALQFDAAGDSQGGSALGFGLAFRQFGISMLLRHSEYSDGFFDQTINTIYNEQPSIRHSQINVNFGARISNKFTLPINFSASRDKFQDGGTLYRATLFASGVIESVYLSNQLEYISNRPPDYFNASTPLRSRLFGGLSASIFYDGKWQLRNFIDYELRPDVSLKNIRFTADRRINQDINLRFGLNHFFNENQNVAQFGVVKSSRIGNISAFGNYGYPKKDFSIGLSLGFGFVFDPFRDRYVLTRPGPGSGGNVAFQAFMDANGNGTYEAGEQPVSNIAIFGGGRPAVTDENGQAFMTDFGNGHSAQLQAVLDDIDDPYVIAPARTIRFNPRAGLVTDIPYPLTPSSEAILYFVTHRQQQMVGLSALQVRLVSDKGKSVEALTQFDGSAGFEQLAPGTYNIELDPVQAARLQMRLKAPAQLIVPAQGGALPDLTIEVVFGDLAQGANVPS
jgi:hypothetical protein